MTLEMILPDQTVPFKVQRILDNRLVEVDQTHGGLKGCWIPVERNPGEFALFREAMVPELTS